jgi:hypothetical protein
MKTLALSVALCFATLPAFSQPASQSASPTSGWTVGSVIPVEKFSAEAAQRCFTAEAIPDGVFRRMQGKSYPSGCTVLRADLRYVRVLHYDGAGKVRVGELVCNKLIADDLLAIFKELYRYRYPIERMQLIDDFGADDERSMRANNTSAFCYRAIKGQKRLSKHALGMAIDINPLYNPCWRRSKSGKVTVQPANAAKYCDRTAQFPYKIDKNDRLYRLFVQYGFTWGGAWSSVKDYQHFER